jgi:hypothetical protein
VLASGSPCEHAGKLVGRVTPQTAQGRIENRGHSLTPSFRLTDTQIIDERAGRPKFFLECSLECLRILPQPLDAQKQAIELMTGGRRFLRGPGHGRRVQPPSLT